ncbi:hypothetical protein [Thiocapsa imhoffii]|uniref:hypothetical protein n=1 Tax=Thiocapsa imhoffii TaxID=382777 RepID=UPI001905DAD5|nr:hypothetical protein [Thiocapsa imhoffii]
MRAALEREVGQQLIAWAQQGPEVTAFVHVRFGSDDPVLEQSFEQEVRKIPQIL